jgi:hypothetical protein
MNQEIIKQARQANLAEYLLDVGVPLVNKTATTRNGNKKGNIKCIFLLSHCK